MLLAYAEGSERDDVAGPLFAYAERTNRRETMSQCIQDLVLPVALRDRSDRWWVDVKASDEFLERLFETYFEQLGLPNLMQKANYPTLAYLVSKELIADEVIEKLDAIVEVAQSASVEPDNV